MAQPTARKGSVDLSEIAAFNVRTGPRCTIAVRSGELADDKRRMLDAALASDSLTAAAISKWLASLGIEISQNTLQRHRRGECSCGRS